MIQPGEIYIADFEQAGRHPVIVVSREELNRGNYVLVVMCTSAHFGVRMNLPNCVPFRTADFGFTRDWVAQCENMLALPVSQLDLASGPIGTENLWRRFFPLSLPTRSCQRPHRHSRCRCPPQCHQGDWPCHRFGLRTELILLHRPAWP